VDLNLWWHILFNLFLDSSKHKRSKNLVKLLDDFGIPLLSFFITQIGRLGSAQIKPLIELIARAKYIWKQKVEKGPQFM
jgi:hypothetical protein